MSINNQTTETQRWLAVLAYFLAYFFHGISGVFFVLFSKNHFLRFHGMQSLIFCGGIYLIILVLFYLGAVGRAVDEMLNLAEIIIWIFLMIKSYQGERYHLPYIGEWAEKALRKV